MDGCHIEINTPPKNKEDYFNRKQYYNIDPQGTADSQLLFQDIVVGFLSSIHYARVLQLSGNFDLAENKEILPEPTRMVYGGLLRPMLVGDSSYPLKTLCHLP